MAGDAPTPPGSASDLQLRLMRAVAAQRARVGSDLNQAQVIPEFDATTKNYVYETAPVALNQLFGSPLAQKGGFAQGPDDERLISSGWGDTLTGLAVPAGATTTYNQSLEFASAIGETVLAAADGIVRFVGVQTTAGGAAVAGVHANESAQTILDANNNVIASSALGNVGFGGIYVTVQHNGDFQGYQTSYYRLSTVAVANGQTVTQGQTLGTVGGAGGDAGWVKANLASSAVDIVLGFQVALASGGLRAIVNPTSLVPNYWPGHPDSTNTGAASAVLLPIIGALGSQIANSAAANLLTALNRGISIENKGVAAVKADMSDHADRTAQTVAVQVSASQAANSGFQGASSQVQNPMTFDFSKGLWNDGKPT